MFETLVLFVRPDDNTKMQPAGARFQKIVNG